MDLEKIYHDVDGNDCNILQLVKKEPEWAANRIQENGKKVQELKEAIDYTKNTMRLRVSITGIASRISRHRGAIDKIQKHLLSEFGKNFSEARQAWLNGDMKTVAEFFTIYV